MPIRRENKAALAALEARVKSILPEQYQDRYEDVQPQSMGSAGLKYGQDGRVAWDQIWATFCDLALAGGPPHKGTMLQPATPIEIGANFAGYQEVVNEIRRGVEMVTSLTTEFASVPGWVGVECVNSVTAEWLLRAITVENVAVRREGTRLKLPAGPSYKMEKEIKNVITVVAKTSHYWFGHTTLAHRTKIRKLFAEMKQESPLLQPAQSEDDFQSNSSQAIKNGMAEMIYKSTALRISNHQYTGWLGVEYPDVRSAVWIMRSLVASNVLSRREGTVLFLPLDPFHDPTGKLAVGILLRLNNFATMRGFL